MSSEYGRRITVNPMLLTRLSRVFQFADQIPCGMRLLVSKPNQLTPVNRTTLPAESTILDPEVDQNPSPDAAAAGCEAASRMAATSKDGPAVHIRRRFMIVSGQKVQGSWPGAKSRHAWSGSTNCTDGSAWPVKLNIVRLSLGVPAPGVQ